MAWRDVQATLDVTVPGDRALYLDIGAGELLVGVSVEPDAASALALALAGAGPKDAVFVTGSLFLVGECLQALAAQKLEPSERAAVPATPASAPGKMV